jgi:hypothetical protein
MAIRFIPSLPRGGIVWDENTSRHISSRIHDAYVIQDNLSFMTGPITGNDGVVYTWVEDKNERTGFVNSSGKSTGNPSSDSDQNSFYMYDKVGAGGSYIIKLGHGIDVNHRWLRGVVGFDARFKLKADSTSSTNDPWVGKIGMIYRNPIDNSEFIYQPTVSFNGPTGDITVTSSYTRVARKFVHNGGPHQDIHDLDLLFTGLIFEYGHSTGGGISETKIYLYIKDFKPIFSTGKDNPARQLGFSEFDTYELLPRMRPWSHRDKIEFDTNVDEN